MALPDSKMTETSTVKLDYPYTVDKIPDWQTGDPENALKALKALKAYEMGNMEESANYFGDSVRFLADKFESHLSNDSLKAMFLKDKTAGNSVTIKMEDWESVKSKDGTDQWVSMWYKEIMTDKAGKIDSVEVMDDAKFENGKITILDEKTRHYAVDKKM